MKFALSIVLSLGTVSAIAQSHCTVTKRNLSPAEIAYYSSAYAKAESLYQEELKASSDSGRAQAAYVRVLLVQDKLTEANAAAKGYLDKHPSDAFAIDSMGEVEFRNGNLSTAETLFKKALAADPCNARSHYDYARMLYMSAMYASAKSQYEIAHKLDPDDDHLWRATLRYLPEAERTAALGKHLHESPYADDKNRSDFDDATARNPIFKDHPCSLSTVTTQTSIQLRPLFSSGSNISYWALDVGFGGKKQTFHLSSTGSGISVTAATAKKLGLSDISMPGVDSNDPKRNHFALAPSIQVGTLEFQNCIVNIVPDDFHAFNDEPGGISLSVFSKYLITLDFGAYSLKLDQLPARPGETKSNEGLNVQDQDANASPSELPDRYVDASMKTWTPVLRTGYSIFVPTAINGGAPRMFLFDTNASTNFMSMKFLHEAGAPNAAPDGAVTSNGKPVKNVQFVTGADLTFGRLRQRESYIYSFDLSKYSHAVGFEVAGYLGIRTLEHLIVSVDYRDNLMDFKYDITRRMTR